MIEVSIIIPCRNEETYIAQCLDSLATQNYPKERLEVLVVDGESEDRTRDRVKPYIDRHPFMRLLDNPRRIIPAAMNIGIKNAKGDIIMKMDAHASYDSDYITRCAQALKKYDADNVGGVLATLPSDTTLQAKAIAYGLSHPLGVGSSPFRKSSTVKTPREADTVAFGCYKKDVFKRIGLYNEHLARSSDMELNLRLKRAGGKIMLIPDIVAYYYPARTFLAFWNHNVNDGIWATYPMRFTKKPLSLRHYVPLLFVLIVIALIVLGLLNIRFFFGGVFLFLLYLLAAVTSSIAIAIKEQRAIYLLLIPIAFFIRHIGYGIGSLIGIGKIFTHA